ncbi:unnamed protein product [Bursaphelenchus okinawaensis]|uniref:Uncharacterized protein n=1 Tax=Bursaphelenchus okinawaensis TaxID=465554 RepID=A0A811KTA8_9BILA|nr:unnamed protein product [Bursaphelenchus okinawaensis]CAG9112303.1 unnamed protein product [Bursaphelenchus okinawaensis]
MGNSENKLIITILTYRARVHVAKAQAMPTEAPRKSTSTIQNTTGRTNPTSAGVEDLAEGGVAPKSQYQKRDEAL